MPRGARQDGLPALLVTLAIVLAAAAFAMWPALPPLHEDELLPLVPLVTFLKEPTAYGAAFMAHCRGFVLGRPFPVISYVIEGPIKALLYLPAFIPSGFRPSGLPFSFEAYRASNVVLVWAVCALMLVASRRVAGTRGAAVACLALVAGDLSFVYLGVTEQTRFLSLVFGLLLFLVVLRQLERPRWTSALTLAALVFVAEWNRADFLWNMIAGLVGCVVGVLVTPRRAAAVLLPVLAGYAVGLFLAYQVVPQYFALAVSEGGNRIPLTDVGRLWTHLKGLLDYVDPFASYHRHIDVAAHHNDRPYVVYRWTFLVTFAVVTAALSLLGLVQRRGAYLLLAAYPTVLLGIALTNAATWAVHHIVIVKPYLYVGAAVVLAAMARVRWLRVPAIVLCAALAVGSAAVNVQGFLAMARAPLKSGLYGVSWNLVDADQAAARSQATAVIALDWGAWAAGVLYSPRTQRWESTGADNLDVIGALMARERLVGFVLRAGGPHAWLLDQARYPTVARSVFRAHPGDPWAFVLLQNERVEPSAP